MHISGSQYGPLCLGTAQLGLNYGIANTHGMPSEDEAERLMQAAWDAGIRSLDTASGYGEAERRIGHWLRRSSARPRLVSKLAPLAEGDESDMPARLRMAFAASCEALSVARLDGYLCHRAGDFFIPGVRAGLLALRDEGLVGGVGLSVYRSSEVPSLQDVDILQVPVSILNQDALQSGLLERCAAKGVVVFARSIYLQGVIFMAPERLPAHLRELAPVIARLNGLARESGLTVGELALLAIRDMPGIASIVVGLDSAAQLADLQRAVALPPLPAELVDEVLRVSSGLQSEIVDPSKWNSLR